MAAIATAKHPSSPPPPLPTISSCSPVPAHEMEKPDIGGLTLPALSTWGGQRHLRCMKAHANGGGGGSGEPNPDPDFGVGLDVREKKKKKKKKENKNKKKAAVVDDGLEQVRVKLMVHLREAADRLNLPVPQLERAAATGVAERKAKAEGNALSPLAPTGPETPSRSLRRRTAAAAPAPIGSHQTSPPRQERSLRPRRACAEKEGSGRPQQRRRFSVALLREEIDEDFYAFTGRRASGRPRKRPHALKKQLDPLFPGLRLSEVTEALYKVAPPTARDRRRVVVEEEE